MERFAGLAPGAYALVAWIGLKLFGGGHARRLPQDPRRRLAIADPDPRSANLPWEMNAVLFWSGMALIVVLSMAVPRPGRRENSSPSLDPPAEGLSSKANGAIHSPHAGPSRGR